MGWIVLQRYALEDMKSHAESIQWSKNQIKFYVQLGKKWKAELDELEAMEPKKDPDTEKIRLDKIAMKTENLRLLKGLIADEFEFIDSYREAMERIERGDFDG